MPFAFTKALTKTHPFSLHLTNNYPLFQCTGRFPPKIAAVHCDSSPPWKDITYKIMCLKPVKWGKRICDEKCYVESICISFYAVSSLVNGTLFIMCELSNSDHESHPGTLKRRHGSIYQSNEVSLFKSPFINNLLVLKVLFHVSHV